MPKWLKNLIIIVAAVAAAVTLTVTIILGVLIYKEVTRVPLDPAKFAFYECYDSQLICLDAERFRTGENGSPGPLNGVPAYFNFNYQRIIGESEDQFIYAKFGGLLRGNGKVVLQNPDNKVDVWQEWTIKEIQVYREAIQTGGPWKKLFYGLANETGVNLPAEIFTVITDGACLQEMHEFVTVDEQQMMPVIGSDIYATGSGYHQKCYKGKSVNRIFVRVLFNESTSIAWETEVCFYQHPETQEWIVTMHRDNTNWDFDGYAMGIDQKEFIVQNIPTLKEVLLKTLEPYLEDRVYKRG